MEQTSQLHYLNPEAQNHTHLAPVSGGKGFVLAGNIQLQFLFKNSREIGNSHTMVGCMLYFIVCPMFKNSLDRNQILQTLPLSQCPGRLLPNPLQVVTSSRSSSVRTTNASASDQPQITIKDPGVHVVGPEENRPHHVQEKYLPPSPISPSHPGSFSNKAEIDCLDGVGPRAV